LGCAVIADLRAEDARTKIKATDAGTRAGSLRTSRVGARADETNLTAIDATQQI
jgi:hypothetical protein